MIDSQARPPTEAAAARQASRVERVLQASTGLLIAAFAGVHLANVAAAARPGAYDAVQRVVRVAYQFPPLELLLLISIALHALLGVRAMRRARAPTSRLPVRLRVHRYAGWYLLSVVALHVGAVRGLAVLEGAPPRFAGLSFSVAWLPWLFAPYYALLALSGLFHGAYGCALALATLGRPVLARLVKRPGFVGALAAGTMAILVGLAGIAGLLYDVGDPFDNPYAAVYRKYLGSFVPGPKPSNDREAAQETPEIPGTTSRR